jgi:Bacterial SH3 domain
MGICVRGLLFSASVIAGVFVLSTARAADCSVEQPRQNKNYTITDVNLRRYPSTYGAPLATLPRGQVVYAFSTYDEWSQVNVATLNIVGYVATKYLAATCVEGKELTRKDLPRAQIVKILMAQSQSRYSGSCPCPYNTDRGGRRCGGRSAYSRPGGASPLCYESDVSAAMVDDFLNEH